MATVAVSLAVLLLPLHSPVSVLASAIDSNHGHGSLLDKRALAPSQYSSVGCYTEGSGGRALILASFINELSMTVTSCIDFCSYSNYTLAGLEYSQECYCGNNLKNNATVAVALECSMPCKGNAGQICGSGGRLSIWSYNGATPVPAPIPSVNTTGIFEGGFTYKGCFQDNVQNVGKTLTGDVRADDLMTQDLCISFCNGKGYSFAGVEYGRECYCGNSLATTVPAPPTECSMPCTGSEAQLCGAGNRLNIFGKQSITTITTTTTTTTTATSTSAAPATTTDSPSFGPDFQFVGCYAEGTTGRALNRDTTTSNALTPQICINYCSGKGYSLAGLEFGVECFCGNDIRNQGSVALAADCSMPCSGDATQTCGNGGRLSVWSLNGATPVIVPPPAVQTNNLPGSWSYSGCYVDPAAPRALSGDETVGTMTPTKCINFCDGKGYKFAGIEYGNECYCGNTLTTAKVAETDCSMSCTSDESHLCGAGNRLTVYENGAFGVTTTTTTTATAVPTPVVQTTGLPSGWVILDCYSDYPGTQVLTGGLTQGADMTPSVCIYYCSALGLTLAGLENGNTCLCDTAIRNNHVPITGCTTGCTGATGTICGGPMKVLIYNYTLSVPPTATSPVPSPSPSPTLGIKKSGFVKPGVQFLGCYQENGNRALPAFVKDNVPITADACIDICQTAGYRLAGMEFSKECWCDNSIASLGTLTTLQADSQCNMPCTGDQYQVCGDAGRITIYNNTQFTPTTPPGGGGGGGVGGGGPLTQVSPKFTIAAGKNYSWVGCYTEGQGVYGRALQGSQSILSNQTVDSCGSYCGGQNFTLFGVEFGVECYCGNILINGPVPIPSLDGCMMPCGGDASQTCGGGQKLQIYSLNGVAPAIRPIPIIRTQDLPDKWYYNGCWHDSVNGPNKAVPFKSVFNGNMTVLNCINHCQLFGYAVAAAQYGDECWCGDQISTDAALVNEIQCSDPCSGNPLELCGAGALSNIYVHNGSLFEWQTPAVTGRYEQFMGGVDVPLLAGVAPYNNKVVFLARLAGGQPNTTHAYEFDWKNRDYKTAFREMHIQTDIFCAAGNILPDSIGRFLAVAGWADEALQGVRVYKPTGQHYENGTTDWEENPPALHLKVARWYPTTATLTNGSIIVVGGSAAANTPNQPSVEILPNPPNSGPTPLELPLLVQTDGHNLYAGVYVLPNTGSLFIFAGERAQLLSQTDFSIQKELPICPNGVLREGYRTYPFTGSYALLPMTAPDYRPEFLVCGGGIGGGGKAHNTCARIGPEDANPAWVVERMPFDRVMPNMVQLPDGTYLIVNGAAEGVAGFGLAKKPVLTAILYDPAAVVHNRMSILNTTVVARMYHSEATLLPDGTVLISGSDPADDDFPEEYRLEIYVPPYIANNPPRPTFALANGASRDLAYGQGLALSVVARTTNQPIRVSFMRDGVNTHSTHMDQRFIWLDISNGPTSRTGSGTYIVRLPPNGSVAPPGWYQIWVLEGPTPCQEHTWVRIGGDPSSMYAWPSVPGYNLTGLGQTVTW